MERRFLLRPFNASRLAVGKPKEASPRELNDAQVELRTFRFAERGQVKMYQAGMSFGVVLFSGKRDMDFLQVYMDEKGNVIRWHAPMEDVVWQKLPTFMTMEAKSKVYLMLEVYHPKVLEGLHW